MRARLWVASLAIAVLTCLPTLSSAAIITADNIGDSGTIQFGGNVGGTNVSALSGNIDVTLIDYVEGTNGYVVLGLEVDNTSTIQSRLSAFGFDTNPDVTSATVTGAEEFTTVVYNSSLPNTFGSIDLCLRDETNPNNCSGGASGGLLPGDAPDTLTLQLNFATLGDQLIIDNFGVRWQSITGVSGGVTYNGASGTGTGTPGGTLFCVNPLGCDGNPPPPPPPPPPVPEPTTMTMLGLGLLGAGILRRRRQ